MKKGNNVFFHGYAYPPSPQARRFGATIVSSPCAPVGNEGLIKNTLLPFFICSFFQFFSFSFCQADAVPPQVCHQDNCVTVEVVSKDADLERGLMYRTSLDQDKGMLFVFPKDDIYQFWMKNMLFDLDMLWISFDGHIVFIGQGIPACTKDPCPVYTPDKQARYVLEINSGYAASHHWKAGDKLDLKGI